MPKNSQFVVPSVKLFPRLATGRRNKRTAAPRVVLRPPLEPTTFDDNREMRRTQVRARLLHMILDNEQVRRNDRRPTAG
jgi:hypothetical protein